MDRTLKLVGKTSNEIFTLRYPATLLDFCEYDFSYFAKHSIDLCNESLKTGVEDHDRVAELRREIQASHCYIEHNIRTVYDKVVLDCWIDYVCRRDKVGVHVLWNRFIRCKSDFEKAVFSRLCDFRYHRAINEWLNIVRVQDYARVKSEFIFVNGLRSIEDAIARRNYFDLAFSVTAREMGCRIEDLGVTKTFSAGRVPTAPFLFPTVSKEIVHNVLGDFDYSEDYSNIGDYSEISDEIAMDAFARMKEGLPQDFSNYGVIRSKMDTLREKIYMPCSLKAAIDLEIDAMIENGEWLGRCKRCGRYFLRDKEHPQEYCSRIMPNNGKTCLEIWEEEHPKKPVIDDDLEKKCREVNEKMFARVDKTMSGREYNYWHSYLEAMKQKVLNGEISSEELENFLDYSLDVDITKSTPIVEVPKKAPDPPPPPKERVVKPFVPERISRNEIMQPTPPDPEEERVLKEGFFTSPSKKRQKNEKPQISHIIRNGESLGEEKYTKNPDPAGFQPFGAPPSPAPVRTPPPNAEPPQKAPERTERRNPYEDLKRLEERLEEEKQLRRERAEQIARQRELDEEEEARRNMRRVFNEAMTFTEEFPVRSAQAKNEVPFEPLYPDEEPPFPIYDDIPEEMKPPVRPRRSEQARTSRPERPEPPKAPEPPETPKPKVIRKNAAAISAYGKASGAPVVTAAEAERVLPRENRRSIEEDLIDDEPFKDIGSIFDVLEQSEDTASGRRTPRSRRSGEVRENFSEPAEQAKPVELPQRVTRENAPAGIWTEDRGLFEEDESSAEPEQSELDILKSKKHGKSNKTRRLYDVIMREPDDNPNFRKK